MNNWIDKLLEATDKAETPRSYIFWAGVATISAVVAPNVFINREGVYKLSPNLFIMLIGESGLGKGLPINIAKKLVRMSDATRVISGRNTVQAIIRDLARTESDEKTGSPKFKDARGFLVSGEFATLLQEDKMALPILTELYDTHFTEEWINTTKSAGVDKLVGVNLSLFGGSTPEHFSNVVPATDVKGGFVGRILTVLEEERHRINPLAETEGEFSLPFDDLVEWLHTLKLVKGPFHFTAQAKKFWIDWYTDIRSKKVQDPTGAINRLPDNVLKVAMCLSLADDVDLRIHSQHLEMSAKRCMGLTVDSQKITGGRGKSPIGDLVHLVIKVLLKEPGNSITKSKLLRRYYGEFDVFDLDRIISTLETAKVIETYPSQGEILVNLLPGAVAALNRFMERS